MNDFYYVCLIGILLSFVYGAYHLGKLHGIDEVREDIAKAIDEEKKKLEQE